MLFTAIKHFVALVGIVFFTTGPGLAAVSAPSAEVAVVAALYKAFSWQAISDADKLFGKRLTQQEEALLRRYFAPELTSLLVEDRRCINRSGEVCNLDFDPIFASQDLGVADLSIASTGRGLVTVEFTYPSNGEKSQLEYRMVKRGKDWRIQDILYRGWDNTSLKQLLSKRLPRPSSPSSQSLSGMSKNESKAGR
jgi:hypothetical protein